jgi:hypothetical protein
MRIVMRCACQVPKGTLSILSGLAGFEVHSHLLANANGTPDPSGFPCSRTSLLLVPYSCLR